MPRSILILIPHFGPWPEWIDFFVESCRANRSIDWILVSDQPPPENKAGNLRCLRTSFDDYKKMVGRRLGIAFAPSAPYKLCDIRPALGAIHPELIAGYDFFGFGDLDLIYGDIRAFYDEETLELHDALSTHAERVSGHLFLMRNREDLVAAYSEVRGWKRQMEDPEYSGFDESGFYTWFRGSRRGLTGPGRPKGHFLFREAYTSPAPTDRMRWYWREGRLTNEFYPHRGFLYLHFAMWRSSRWYSGHPHIAPGAVPPWQRLGEVVRTDWRDARRHGFTIGPDGIGPFEPPLYR